MTHCVCWETTCQARNVPPEIPYAKAQNQAFRSLIKLTIPSVNSKKATRNNYLDARWIIFQFVIYYKDLLPYYLSRPKNAEGGICIKENVAQWSNLGPKRCNFKIVTKKIPFKFVLGWLADADGAVGGFSSKDKHTQINGIAINPIDNKK